MIHEKIIKTILVISAITCLLLPFNIPGIDKFFGILIIVWLGLSIYAFIIVNFAKPDYKSICDSLEKRENNTNSKKNTSKSSVQNAEPDARKSVYVCDAKKETEEHNAESTMPEGVKEENVEQKSEVKEEITGEITESKVVNTVEQGIQADDHRSEAKIREDNSKPAVLKEAQEILLLRKEEFDSEIKPLNKKYTGNIDTDVYNFYGRFIELLDKYLKSKKIICNDLIYTNEKCEARNIIDEEVHSINSLYMFRCRDMEFAFDENGKHLWRISPDNVSYAQWYDRLKESARTKEWRNYSYDILAVLATKDEVYVLFQSGLVKSTDPKFEEVNLFKKIDEARRICAGLPVQAVLDVAQTIDDLDRSHYYSWSMKSFIFSFTDGSYDTGVYRVYSSTSKEYFLENYLVDINLYEMWAEVKKGTVPMFAAMDCLPEDTTVKYRDETLIY